MNAYVLKRADAGVKTVKIDEEKITKPITRFEPITLAKYPPKIWLAI